MDQIIIQGIGYLALIFVIFSFQNNGRSKILFLMLIGVVLFILHYALLGAVMGSLMNLMGAGMIIVAYKKDTQLWAQKALWPYAFIILFILVGMVTAKSYIDVLPVLALIIGTIATWQTNTRAIRFIMLVPRPLWFTYNLVVGSYAGMTVEVLLLLSIIIGIIRFDLMKQVQKKNKS